MELETNGPPVTSALQISPESGSAFITPFTFKTTPAEDIDGPLLYSFGIIVDDMTLVLQSGYEFFEIETHLPFSSKFSRNLLMTNNLIGFDYSTQRVPSKPFTKFVTYTIRAAFNMDQQLHLTSPQNLY